MSYLGNTPTTQNFISGTDYFNGTGSQTAFTLSRTVNSVNDIQVVVNNVVQQPNDAYTLSGTTLTMTSAPSAGTNNVYVRYLSTTTQVITPSQNTVSYSTLNSDNQSKLGVMYKNRIINGNMVIDQRNAGASVTVNSTSQFFSVDRFVGRGDTEGVFTLQQSSTVPVGFVNSLKATVTTADSSIGATQRYEIYQRIEGYNIADLNWGTANAKTITLSFWTQSSLTGTFGGSLSGDDGTSYPFTYTISSANTWEYKTITIVGPTIGTWLTTNGLGIWVNWSLGAGSTRSGTAGAWSSNLYTGATGQTQVISTNGATFYLTGVQLEVGTQATAFSTAGGSYGAELALCQRYCFVNDGQLPAGYWGSSSTFQAIVPFPVTMRATPSLTLKTAGLVINPNGNDGTIVNLAIGTSSGTTSCHIAFTGITGATSVVVGSGGFTRGHVTIFSSEL